MRIQFLVVFLITIPFCNAQVTNDNIENRIKLALNQPHFSQTDNCTLQPTCLNKQIEHKCITYHNDQWFEFSVNEAKPYYINIAKQNCRDVQGVQLVVINGEPCQPETYTSLGCVSLNTQDDIYLRLDSLKPNHNYLLLVDGYLEDYCKFEIELSDQPKGKPRISSTSIQLNIKLTRNVLDFAWTVNNGKSNNYNEYEIYKRESKAHKSTLIKTIDHEKDAYGKSQLVYTSSDTLTKTGLYFYEVYANLKNNGKEFLGYIKQKFDANEYLNKYSNHNLIISRTYKKSTPLEILITDALSDKVIISDYKNASRDHQLFYNIKPALNLGSRLIKITLKDVRKNRIETYEVDWNQYLKE